MKYLKILLIFLIFGFGLVIGIVFNDIPNIKLNTEVKIFEPLSFLLTATIGLLIPFFIKRWIDDSRQVKNNLNEELKETLREVAIIKDKVKFCYHNKSISQSDKQEINVLFEQADLRIYCLEQQFIESYDKETKQIREDIKSDYLNYWKLTTSAEVMSDKFTSVNENFYSRHNDCFSKFETRIKQTINKVNRF
jgi:phosphorylcholine metabolism protein LicD